MRLRPLCLRSAPAVHVDCLKEVARGYRAQYRYLRGHGSSAHDARRWICAAVLNAVAFNAVRVTRCG